MFVSLLTSPKSSWGYDGEHTKCISAKSNHSITFCDTVYSNHSVPFALSSRYSYM